MMSLSGDGGDPPGLVFEHVNFCCRRCCLLMSSKWIGTLPGNRVQTSPTQRVHQKYGGRLCGRAEDPFQHRWNSFLKLSS